MNIVATNIRFPRDEYRELKLLALSEGKSAAGIIREAVKRYKDQKFNSRVKLDLAEQARKLSVKIDVPVIDLVRQDRRY